MKVSLPAGRYVVAVSGGVDSVVLLDLICQQPSLKLTVAHFDHGIRDDSVADRRFVQQLAAAHRLPFVYDRAELGAGASEAVARKARYEFLHRVRQVAGARAILTAHHADDRLETAIINLLRGTGRRGLSALKSHDLILRPLLGYSKQTLRNYAEQQNLRWHEDSTNQDEAYLRNYVRHQILSKFSPAERQALTKLIRQAQQTNHQIDNQLVNLLHQQAVAGQLDRSQFISLPHAVALEFMASWLRAHSVSFDRKLLQRLVIASKSLPPGKQMSINRHYVLEVGQHHLALRRLDR